MYTHRRSISSLLQSSNQTRTRFLRLFILSLLILAPALPSYIFTITKFIQPDPITGAPLHSFSWSTVHTDWNQVVLIPAGYGAPQWDRWCWIAYGYVIFFCFGVGEDARREYRSWAAACGFAQCFPSLRKEGNGVKEMYSPNTSRGSVASYIAEKSKWVFAKSSRNGSVDSGSKKVSWLSSTSGTSELSGSTAYELPIVEPSHQPKKASKTSKWASFVNMPGSFAQAVAGAQNLPQRPIASATFSSSTSSGDGRARSMEYV